MRLPPTPTGRTWLQMSCWLPHGCHPHLKESAAGDSPPILGTDDVVIVETGRVHAGGVVGQHDQRIDIGARLGRVAVDRDHLIGQAVHGVAGQRVGLLHELGHRVDTPPGTDFAVVQLAVVGEDGAEQRPVAPVDPGGVAHENIGDVLAVFSFGHTTSPFGWTTIRGGPSDFRARSSASGTSSRSTIAPTLGSGSSRPEAMASRVPYQSCGCGPPPNWMATPCRVASVTLSESPLYQPPAQ